MPLRTSSSVTHTSGLSCSAWARSAWMRSGSPPRSLIRACSSANRARRRVSCSGPNDCSSGVGGGSTVSSASGWVSCSNASTESSSFGSLRVRTFQGCGFQGFRGSAGSGSGSSSSEGSGSRAFRFRGSRHGALRGVWLRWLAAGETGFCAAAAAAVRLVAPAAARPHVVGRWRGRCFGFENFRPVELDIGVLIFYPADSIFVERGTSHLARPAACGTNTESARVTGRRGERHARGRLFRTRACRG